jgi:hypothetical protein
MAYSEHHAPLHALVHHAWMHVLHWFVVSAGQLAWLETCSSVTLQQSQHVLVSFALQQHNYCLLPAAASRPLAEVRRSQPTTCNSSPALAADSRLVSTLLAAQQLC